MLTFRHFESFSLSLFVVITLVVCSLEVLVDVGERGGAKVVVGHGLNEAFSKMMEITHVRKMNRPKLREWPNYCGMN